jgi:hypothetical protein
MERTDELLRRFDEYLRRIGYAGIPNASRMREMRKTRLEKLLRQEKYDLLRLPGAVEQALAQASDREERQILEEIRDFLRSVLPSPEVEEKPSPEVEERRRLEVPAKEARAAPRPGPERPPDIGRIAPAMEGPASHLEFPFWVSPEAQLAIGEIVTAESPDGAVQVVGAVQALQAVTTLRTAVEHFMACDMGRPGAALPTDIPTVLIGTAGILWRSDGRFAPPERDWILRRAIPKEIRQALSGGVEPAYAVPAGFIPAVDEAGRRVWVPVDMDLRWLAGYESGHINIAGISGVAAKTSYGLFLAMGMLAAAAREGPVRDREGGLAVIAFNVKEVDLMYLDRWAEWEKAPAKFQEDLEMWGIFRQHYLENQDPGTLLDSKRLDFRAPGRERAVASLRTDPAVRAFRYAWKDIRELPGAFYALFDPDDLDDRMLGVIEAVLGDEKVSSWESLGRRIREVLSGEGEAKGSSRNKGNQKARPRSEGWVEWGGASHHAATLYKLRNRLDVIREAMGAMLEDRGLSGEPLRPDRLEPGHFWVVDITRLGDRARRFLFFRLLGELQDLLEKRKTGHLSGKFPGRVVVFVDELNVFAPGGGGRHPTRERLVHLAARGRSIGLTLLGMQQLASRVDDEVLANTSTLAVGRVHPAELSGPAYAWLRAWRDQVMALPTGSMLVSHPLWRAPVVVRFPRPLHRLAAEARWAEIGGEPE